jgi:predicted amidophosphoribosyltransferase
LAEAAPLTSYTTCTSSAEAKSLVIVDETYGTGKSVAATLKVLRENGLQHSDKCKITIAVALKVK